MIVGLIKISNIMPATICSGQLKRRVIIMAKGMLHLTCEKCGHTNQYFSREHINTHTCRNCGHETLLQPETIHSIYVNCECGTNTYVKSNCTESMVDVKCVNCKQLVAVEFLPKKNHYVTINNYKNGEY